MTMFQNLRRVMTGGATLKIECEACGRRITWGRDEAFRKLGADATPFDIRRRLQCEGCGVKGQARAWI